MFQPETAFRLFAGGYRTEPGQPVRIGLPGIGLNPAAVMLPLLIPTLLLCTGGCESGGATPRPNSQPPPTKMLGSIWALVALGGEEPLGDEPLTLELGEDGRVGGFAGVNRYFGDYELEEPTAAGSGKPAAPGTVKFGELGATRMAGPPEMMEQERRYLDALRAVDRYRAEGGLLELSAGRGPLLRFRKIGNMEDTPPGGP